MATLITTKFLSATNNRGARISATANYGDHKTTVTVSYDYAARDPHLVAMDALMEKLNAERAERLGTEATPYVYLAGVGSSGDDRWTNCTSADNRGFVAIVQ